MELLEVRRAQEEEEKKRQPPAAEAEPGDAAAQQRSEWEYNTHTHTHTHTQKECVTSSGQKSELKHIFSLKSELWKMCVFFLVTRILPCKLCVFWEVCLCVCVCVCVCDYLFLVCVCREGETVSQNGLPSDQESPRVSYRSPAYQKYSSTLQSRRPTAAPRHTHTHTHTHTH